VTVVVSIVTILLPLPAQASTPTTAPSAIAAALVGDINAVRTRHGLTPYAISPELTALAQSWSRHQAARGDVFHNLDMYASLSGRDWSRVNENVGVGSTEADIEAAFEASPDHVANYVNTDYTHVGVGVVVTETGAIYVTEDFGQAAPARRPTAVPSAKSRVADRSTRVDGALAGAAPPVRTIAIQRPTRLSVGQSGRVRLVLEQLRALDNDR
jgi:hypothetical protein